ncbi:hypothetical protein DAKH74_006180 [Maudiozyma humilis]|uniref:ABC transporter domain-containing protein n=1 Tax=Maudiozyma humilis TaxID=51915 RepID=A0AAV5RRU4_MAUHU|nr:hypothetical protein DAKH74_006180 [Kazachstania humilis]
MPTPIVTIHNATFRASLARNAAPIFPHPLRSLQLNRGEKWALCGTGKAQLMNALSNKYLCTPPLSLRYGTPRLATRGVPRVECVQFSGAVPTAHLSARYEYFKDEFDQTCGQFVLNDSIGSRHVAYDVALGGEPVDRSLYAELLRALQLSPLENRWAMGLSNGQMRRARLARAVLRKPDLLLVDDPFLGLDPGAAAVISEFLATSEERFGVPAVVGLRWQDAVPQWATHLCGVDASRGVLFAGERGATAPKLAALQEEHRALLSKGASTPGISPTDLVCTHPLFGKGAHETLRLPAELEFRGVGVTYRGEPVLRDLEWRVAQGSKWHVRGDNGSGKSTLLSLIAAEHPQSWNRRVVQRGVPRATGATSYFDVNKRLAMSSPELHAIFVKRGKALSVRESVASGLHEASNNNFQPLWSKLPQEKQQLVQLYLDYFGLGAIESRTFGELSVSEQKLVLFVRALVKMPELLVLDEAFSGMEDTAMLRCMRLLDEWPGTTLVVAHVQEETPKCDHYIRLLGPGKCEIGDVENTEG